MDKPEAVKTLGQAIDLIVEALRSLDEASRVTAINAACEHLKVAVPEKLGSVLPPAQGGPPTPPTPAQTKGVDVRALKDEKRPSTGIEMAALVAFYLAECAPENDRKPDVSREDMVRYFKQAGFPLPKAQFLLPNAKNAGYFDAVGGGKYRLNAVGYNLVAHNLPRGEEKRSSTAGTRPRKNKTGKRRGPTKQQN
jgi:hypothetical protein